MYEQYSIDKMLSDVILMSTHANSLNERDGIGCYLREVQVETSNRRVINPKTSEKANYMITVMPYDK